MMVVIPAKTGMTTISFLPQPYPFDFEEEDAHLMENDLSSL
jgi:hypothetical protein